MRNNIDDTYDALAKLNGDIKDILFSSEYIRHMTLKKASNALKTLDFKAMYEIIRLHEVKKIVSHKYCKYLEPARFNYEKCDQNKRIVIYSCVTGKYENVRTPIRIDDGIDYIMYSDSHYDGWRNREIPEIIRDKDSAYQNRYCKMHPLDCVGSQYDFSIYIDGNVRVVGNPYSLCGAAQKSDLGIAMYLHRERNCIYEEAEVCKLYRKGSREKINRQIEKYKQEGFPKCYGMNECTVIVCDLKNMNCQSIMKKWWDEFERSNSGRDQLSLPYVLWKNNKCIEDIGELGNNILKDNRIDIRNHSKYTDKR